MRSAMTAPLWISPSTEITLPRLTCSSITVASAPATFANKVGQPEQIGMTDKLSPTEIYRDRKIFLIGGTGFLGKVTLSMLLYRFPNIRRVYVTVRARSQQESEARFWNNVLTEPPFDPLRERYASALDGFIRDKVEVVGGDIAESNLGFSDEEAQRIAGDIDVVINSA